MKPRNRVVALAAAILTVTAGGFAAITPVYAVGASKAPAAAKCVKKGTAANQATTPETLGRGYAKLALSGKPHIEVAEALAHEWCLTRLSTTTPTPTPTPTASATDSFGTQSLPPPEHSRPADVDFSGISLFYDTQVNHYYAMGQYKWNTNTYFWDQEERLCVPTPVGGDDGAGIRVTGSGYAPIGGSFTYWGGKQYDAYDNDFGIDGVSFTVANEKKVGNGAIGVNQWGVTATVQDKIVNGINNGECSGPGSGSPWDFSLYNGLILYGFDKVTTGCSPETAYMVYGHTYEQTTITGFNAAIDGFGLNWLITEKSWQAGELPSKTVNLCQNTTAGTPGNGGGGGGGGGGTPPVAAPVARIWTYQTTASCGVLVNLTAAGSTGTGLTYSWNFGDGTAANGVVAQHSYPRPGSYNVSLTVTDANGNQSTATVQIKVRQPAGDADINGDGKDDLVAQNLDSIWARTSNGTGFNTESEWGLGTFYGSTANHIGDVNGDGKDDLIAQNDSSIWVRTSNGTGFDAGSEWGNGGFFGNLTNHIGDVNGDGKDDLIAQNDASVWVRLSTGTGFAAGSQWAFGAFSGNVTNHIGDVNGDGKDDLIAQNADSVWVRTSTGTGFSDGSQWVFGSFSGNVTNHIGDVNGDGKDDLIAQNADSVWVRTSTGTGFSDGNQWVFGSFFGNLTNHIGDVNGDGKDDLIAQNGDSVWVRTSTGTGFSDGSQWAFGGFSGTVTNHG